MRRLTPAFLLPCASPSTRCLAQRMSPHLVKVMRRPSGDQEGSWPSVSFRGWPLPSALAMWIDEELSTSTTRPRTAMETGRGFSQPRSAPEFIIPR
jgi:hypothetical protein